MAKIKKFGFTLIELLVVVMIIAILSAIAVPNFMEAQSRAKVSRTKADMRSVATGIEAYAVDNNNFPPGFNTAPLHSLYSLTTPVQYIQTAFVIDPFSKLLGGLSKQSLTYELMNAEGKIVENSNGPYSVNPLTSTVPVKGTWWWLASRGPDRQFGLKNGESEYNIAEKIYKSNQDSGPFVSTLYDPSNGTYSIGNIYRAGGSISNVAGKLMTK